MLPLSKELERCLLESKGGWDSQGLDLKEAFMEMELELILEEWEKSYPGKEENKGHTREGEQYENGLYEAEPCVAHVPVTILDCFTLKYRSVKQQFYYVRGFCGSGMGRAQQGQFSLSHSVWGLSCEDSKAGSEWQVRSGIIQIWLHSHIWQLILPVSCDVRWAARGLSMCPFKWGNLGFLRTWWLGFKSECRKRAG